MKIKAKLVDLLQRAQEEERVFVAGLSDDERSATGAPERWSAKDVVAHLAEWRARTVASLAAARRGVPAPTYDDIDEANAEILQRYRDEPWEDVLRKSESAYSQLIEHVQAMTEDELADTQRLAQQNGRPLWRIIVGNDYSHPIAHLAQFYAERGDRGYATLLQETAAQLLASLGDSPRWQGTVIYNLACHYALIGEKEKAITKLSEAFQLYPDLVEWSKQDSDLVSIREEPAYRSLETGNNEPKHVNLLIDPFHLRETLALVLDHLLPVAADVEYRLVGTAAALLQGVQMPAGDIDLLVKARKDVDTFSSALSSFKCRMPPIYLAEEKQYYAAYEVNGVEVGISTVEWETDSDGIECLGRGPWEHFVLIPCGAYAVPTVALELRLVSELVRDRPERYIPLILYMQAHGCDIELVRRGMAARALPPALQENVISQLKGKTA